MRVRLRGFRARHFAAAAVGCAALCSALPAAARPEHRHVYHHAQPYFHPEQPAPSAGFGPTSAGVSSIVIDAASGAVITATAADVPRYPASLTKLMVLDLAFQALRAGRMTLDTPLPISAHAASVEPVKLGLEPGDNLTVRQAILAMTTMSANDAATALGEFLGGGSEDRVAQMMTLRAHALGMAQTQFANASGLPNPNQISTARDLSILARDIVVAYPEDQQFFEVQKFSFYGHMVYSNNGMLKSYPGATGMKTGYTDLARHNLITSATRNGRVLIGVEMHEPSWPASYQQMTAMLDGGFGGHVAGANVQFANNAAAAVTGDASTGTATAAPAQTASSRQKLAGAPLPLANQTKMATATGWTAQLGIFSRMNTARIRAIRVERMAGLGIARVARLELHGKTLWTAQLAGLTLNGAHATCDAVTARGDSCRIIAPSVDHLAMDQAGSGARDPG